MYLDLNDNNLCEVPDLSEAEFCEQLSDLSLSGRVVCMVQAVCLCKKSYLGLAQGIC